MEEEYHYLRREKSDFVVEKALNPLGGGERKLIYCYIYGIGKQYNVLSSYLKIYQEKIEILALVTTKPQEITYLDGKKIIRPWDMEKDKVDYVIVAMKEYKEVLGLLRELGFSDKILRSDIFSIPNFVLEDYLKVRKSRPSILANTCIGGFVYNVLGLEILSPTISMRCMDYIQFLKKYKFYLSQDIKVQENDYLCDELYYGETFAPKGISGDTVCWWFVHAKDGTTEAEKWNRRRKRINYANIIALMIIRTDEEACEFDKLPIQKKLGFYHKDLRLESILYTPEWNDVSLQYKYQYQYDKFVHQVYVKNMEGPGRVDWIKFLNGEKNFLRF